MKKLFNLFASAIVILCALTSCGSSKESATVGLGPEIEKSPAQIYAEANRATRAWGNATHFRQQHATRLASNDARAKFAEEIATAILAATKSGAYGVAGYSSDGNTGSTATNQGATDNVLVRSIAQNLVEKARVEKTSTYLTKDNQYLVYVAIEYIGDLAKDAAEAFVKSLPEDEQDKIINEIAKFEDEIESQINK